MSRIKKGQNDLLSVNPSVCKEWHKTLNGELTPDMVTASSGRKVWWKCGKCGYEWQSLISNRNKGSGCPHCAGKARTAWKGHDDLATVNPRLAQDWNYGKNRNLRPDEVISGTPRKVWWKCSVCEYEWEASISSRHRGNGCPHCAGQAVWSGHNDLATLNSELAEEWNYEKNGDLKPTMIVPGSNKRVWWKCRVCQYEWKTSVQNRNGGTGCPLCSGNVVKEGHNDIATTHPSLLDEWNYEKNGTETPQTVSSGSNKKVWWKCSICGNEWKTAVHNRAISGTGCPRCALAFSTSEPEQIIYFYVKQHFDDAINSYHPDWLLSEKGHKQELDIYIPSLRLAIEYDGERWHRDAQKDRRKTQQLLENAVSLVRFREYGCPELNDGSFCILTGKPDSNRLFMNEPVQQLFSYINGQYNLHIASNVDIERDYLMILAGYNALKASQSLAIDNPELALEWNYEKNGELKPSNVGSGTGKRVWWKCPKCSHEWKASIASRRTGIGCPYCAGHILRSGYNDIETRNPNMAKQWNYERNGDLVPAMIAISSNKRVWWLCQDCGYEWAASPNSRGNHGCPRCAGQVAWEGHNDLASQNPKLVLDWDYEKNGELTPNNVAAGTTKKAWWRCHSCGYEWQASIASRNRGNGCPSCSNRVVRPGKNDLATVNPNLASEWNHGKNGELLPSMVLPRSNKKVWWQCSKCSYEWQSMITNRTSGTGCPVCSGNKVWEGHNDLSTKQPELAKEWNYEKNGELLPTALTAGSNKKVWWKCSACGHEWKSTVNNRTYSNNGCPQCHHKAKKP